MIDSGFRGDGPNDMPAGGNREVDVHTVDVHTVAEIIVLAEATPDGVTARCNACGWETKLDNSELLGLLAAFSQSQPPNNEMKLAILEHRLDHLEGRV